MLQRFSIHERVRAAQFYKSEGYAIFSDLFRPAELEWISHDIFGLFEHRFQAAGIIAANAQELMLDQYSKNRETWRDCASKMWDTIGVLQCASKQEVYETLKALNLQFPVIATRPEIRTDMPGDVLFMQPWHQDWSYGQTSLNAITVWVPLQDVTPQHGAIDIVPGSHKLGLLRTIELRDPRRLRITDERFREDGVQTVGLRLGECVFFSQFLVHRSGYNSSGKVRLTFQGRYADYGEKTFSYRGYRDSISAGASMSFAPSSEDLKAFFG